MSLPVPPLVMGPAFQIDATNNPVQGDTTYQRRGPWRIGQPNTTFFDTPYAIGNLYSFVEGGSGTSARVEMSQDRGLTWVPQDDASANRPQPAASPTWVACALTPTQNFLYVLWPWKIQLDTSITPNRNRYYLALSRFNFATLTWDQMTQYNNITSVPVVDVGTLSTQPAGDSRKILACQPPFNAWLLAATSDLVVYGIMLTGPTNVGHDENSAGWTNFSSDAVPTNFRTAGGGSTTWASVRIDGLVGLPSDGNGPGHETGFSTSGDLYAVTSAPSTTYSATIPTTPQPSSFQRQWVILAGTHAGLSGTLSDDIYYYNNGIGPTFTDVGGVPFAPAFGMQSSYGGVPLAYYDIGNFPGPSVDVVAIPVKDGNRLPCVDRIINRATAVREVVGNIPACTSPIVTPNMPPAMDQTIILTYDLNDLNQLNLWFLSANDIGGSGVSDHLLYNAFFGTTGGSTHVWAVNPFIGSPIPYCNLSMTPYIPILGVHMDLSTQWTGRSWQVLVLYANGLGGKYYFTSNKNCPTASSAASISNYAF